MYKFYVLDYVYIYTICGTPNLQKAGSLVLPDFDSCQNMLWWGGEHVQLLLPIID